MKRWGWMRTGLVCLLCCAAAAAQRDRLEPLTEAQQDQLAEAGIDPGARIALYTKFLNERANRIEAIGKRNEAGRGQRLNSELGEFSALVDEIASNLDQYGERKSDLRKALKDLNEAIGRWQGILNGLRSDRADEIALTDARETLADLFDQGKKLAANQEEYFKEHKDRAGQQREEPE